MINLCYWILLNDHFHFLENENIEISKSSRTCDEKKMVGEVERNDVLFCFCFPRYLLKVNGETVLYLTGSEAPWSKRQDRKRHPTEVYGPWESSWAHWTLLRWYQEKNPSCVVLIDMRSIPIQYTSFERFDLSLQLFI